MNGCALLEENIFAYLKTLQFKFVLLPEHPSILYGYKDNILIYSVHLSELA